MRFNEVTPHDDSNESAQLRCKVPQNAIAIELCLRITNAKPALARWIGVESSGLAKCEVLSPLLATETMEYQFDIGGSQRRFG